MSVRGNLERGRTLTSRASPPVNIPVGDIQFFDNWMPPLEDGAYRITVTQSIGQNVGQSVNPLALPFVAQQYFQVAGPRFTLDPSDVYSVYPPSHAQGDFSNTLPHVILTRRTLPWERTLDGNTPSADNLPWLALLLFDDDEIFDESSPPGSGNPSKAQMYPISQIINPGPGILGPQISPASIQNEQEQGVSCLAIDIPPDVFTALVPGLNELKYLAHCREVNTGNKAILGIEADGWFSIVIGNRVPNCSPLTSPVTPGAKNIAHLVSLEGFMSYLPGGSVPPQPVSGYQKIRLVSLASWGFSCQTSGDDFAALAQNLGIGTLRAPAQWVQSPPVLESPAAEKEMQSAEAVAVGALELGYVPLDYTTRQGEHTVAWFRGPLTPVFVQPAGWPPFTTEEEAMIYDAGTGLFDLSYAVAWQIGRLLGLSDRSFALDVLNWVREGHRLIDLLFERIHLFRNFDPLLKFPSDLSGRLDRRLMRALIGSFLQSDFADRVAPEAPEAAPLLGRGSDPSGLSKHVHRMPGLLSEEDLVELLAHGADPAHALRKKLFGG